MAFEQSESTGTFKKHTGVCLGQMATVINPTLKDLKDIGITFEKEPVYLAKTKDNKDYVNVSIYLKFKIGEKEQIQAISFPIFKEVKQNKDKTKTQFIDRLGNTAWAAKLSDIEETKDFGKGPVTVFDKASGRTALSGEEELIKFFKNIYNVKKGGEACYNVEKLFKGDFSELRSSPIAKLGVWVLLTVRGGKYQSIFNGWSERGFTPYLDAVKRIEDYAVKQTNAGYPLKDSWSIQIKEYNDELPDSDIGNDTPKVNDSGLPF